MIEITDIARELHNIALSIGDYTREDVADKLESISKDLYGIDSDIDWQIEDEVSRELNWRIDEEVAIYLETVDPTTLVNVEKIGEQIIECREYYARWRNREPYPDEYAAFVMSEIEL